MRPGRSSVLLLAAAATAACSGADEPAAPTVSTATAATTITAAPTATSVTTAVPSEATTSTSQAVTTSSAEPSTSAAGRDFSELASIVDGFVADRELNGAGLVIVDRDDGIVYHEHWGEFDEDRVSFVASSSKMITAGVLLRLQDDGVLDIDAPVADVVAWGSANPEITPAQLVSNSSGLVGLAAGFGVGPYLCQFLPAGTLQQCAEQIFTTGADDDVVVAPDTEFRYGGAQWQIAGAVAEAASGRSWDELIDEIYVQPCGLESLGYNNHFTQLGSIDFEYPDAFDGDISVLAPTDNPNLEAGVYTTTGDYAQLLLMHLRGGRCGEVQVLSAEALDRLHTDRVAEAYDGSAGPGRGYGMGWWIDRDTGRLTDEGAYGSVPWLDLDDGYGAYLVIEADSGTGSQLAALLYDPVEAAMTAPE